MFSILKSYKCNNNNEQKDDDVYKYYNDSIFLCELEFF